MDCSWATLRLLSKAGELPHELLTTLRDGSNQQYLKAITDAALDPAYTYTLFTHLEPLFSHCCAAWVDLNRHVAVVGAFGRILPFAPHLTEYAEVMLSRAQGGFIGILINAVSKPEDIPELEASELLLGAFRLVAFDSAVFETYLHVAHVRFFLQDSRRTVRYLAVRLLCLYLHSADAATERLISTHLGTDPILGKWERKNIVYHPFLGLWEEKRFRDISEQLRDLKIVSDVERSSCRSTRVIKQEDLHPCTVEVQGVLLPRIGEALEPRSDTSHLVPTTTTSQNVRRFASALLSSDPILLTGLPGSGKTSIVTHVARLLGKLSSLVTLHLNDQSDAKMLVGMYTTGATPGSFSWQPGVLTTAVREGRWVFIEDLDRAPNEVISTILPLLERRELFVPSRGETVKAARGFRIIATVRSSMNLKGEESSPGLNLVGSRFWTRIQTTSLPDEELTEIITVLYPLLGAHVAWLTDVYSQLQSVHRNPAFTTENKSGIVRFLTPRDLLKWCDRMSALISDANTYTSSDVDVMFLEAIDCFAGSLPSCAGRDLVAAHISEGLHLDPRRRDHLLSERSIKSEFVGKDRLRIGRTSLRRIPVPRNSRKPTVRGPFATSVHIVRLLEKVAVATERKEPVLLVGETGIGKTTCVQHLAEQLGRKLVAFNLSQQSESSDLLGGFKPVNVRSLVIPMKDEFDELFHSVFPRKNNEQYLTTLAKYVAKGQWTRVCHFWKKALEMVDEKFSKQQNKKQRTDKAPQALRSRWGKFAMDVNNLERQLSSRGDAMAFAFIKGAIVKAVRNGDWVLLDEINLASSDTLESLADLLDTASPSILLTEAGNVERIEAHPDFRIFAAMNPATDTGKKDLPMGIRSRFTELYVESPDRDMKSLQTIVETYLAGYNLKDTRVASDVTRLYFEIQSLAAQNRLVDGADQKPHFSLRTLTRTLSYATEMSPLCTLRRALYEGFHMSFLTVLNEESERLLSPLIAQHLLGRHANAKAELRRPLRKPGDSKEYVQEGHHWLRRGNDLVEDQPHYIVTPFIRRNLDNLLRAVSTRRYPVLIQGPTSSGKTSMIEYLARRSGNKFVRINNHEHTDLQEYLGTYVSDSDGQLHYQEGILVKALREGHWVVLDELNLAPTDVLEALNRLLDDNRELLIPETQEVIRPHENFILFATQNPAGVYGGRKPLSRAFRNRFLELHFDDIPVNELAEILHRRTKIPESWSSRIVNVYRELSTAQQKDRVFEQFATLRDLFRWAFRKADTMQQLAVNGYMLLAERVRNEDEREYVKNVIERVMGKSGLKVQIDDELLYAEKQTPEIQLYNTATDSGSVVWTRAMRRLHVLVVNAVRNNEPVLLVGETGCGKTTVCQMLADAFGKSLYTVNAHQNTETGDLIGSQRPVRNRVAIEERLRQGLLSALGSDVINGAWDDSDLDDILKIYDTRMSRESQDTEAIRFDDQLHLAIRKHRTKLRALFEWSDGSLVHSMKTGQYFLLDEISLADDSVLERLNSVLEPQRTLLLAEKGPVESLVVGAPGFQFFATMNPGGDHGKRELSPALRNRFTEIWVPALSDTNDIHQIISAKLSPLAAQYAPALVDFAVWFSKKYNASAAHSPSIRDMLSWVSFINGCTSSDPIFGILHGAAMVFIDTLGANPASILSVTPGRVDAERLDCLEHLSTLLKADVAPLYFENVKLTLDDGKLGVGPFWVTRTDAATEDPSFTLLAPTTLSNAMRVVRALQLPRAVLLEGNPGVGKTTLVTALAKAIGKPLTRINLSEQTDLMDLFGCDIPTEGGHAGMFTWRDGPFLRAMKNGEWVLLDEMNLASQSVLEGLNACLDHRGEVYVSELDQIFPRHPNFRVFAAQNPHSQGGGRKGLPASFVNRFTVVYADIFRAADLLTICKQVVPGPTSASVEKLIDFVAQLDDQASQRRFGALGGPWEFNLRDTLRWLQLTTAEQGLLKAGEASDFLNTIFVQRFRTPTDRTYAISLFTELNGHGLKPHDYFHDLSQNSYQVGLGLLQRQEVLRLNTSVIPSIPNSQLQIVESLLVCIQNSWPAIIVGASGSGKSRLIHRLAAINGAPMVTLSMSAEIDATDLVGGYEQVDPFRGLHDFLVKLDSYVRRVSTEDYATANISERTIACGEIIQLLGKAARAHSDGDVFPRVCTLLGDIAQSRPTSEATTLHDQASSLLSSLNSIDRARFEWVDGALVRALEQGEWLVLDNANLCSSSVLDRLNSLLEPNGYLSISEHATEDGEARVVKPHPNFRMFMTMDPRYGELSRAMRNRCVELFLFSQDSTSTRDITRSCNTHSSESSVYRYRHFQGSCSSLRADDFSNELTNIAFDHLSFTDADLFEHFVQEVSEGLLDSSLSSPPEVSQSRELELLSRYGRSWKSDMMSLYQQSAEKSGRSKWKSINTLNNPALFLQATRDAGRAYALSSLYETCQDLVSMYQAIESTKDTSAGTRNLTRLERSMAIVRIPNAAKDSTVGAATFLNNVRALAVNSIQDMVFNNRLPQDIIDSLEQVRVLWWNLFALLQAKDFDESVFQVYLAIARTTFSSVFPSNETSQRMRYSLQSELNTFKAPSQLSTGLSMTTMWTALRAPTPTTYEHLQQIVEIKRLADRFDALAWKSGLTIDELSRVHNAFSTNILQAATAGVPVPSFIEKLSNQVAAIETMMPENPTEVEPYFVEQYEGLCQYGDLNYMWPTVSPPTSNSNQLRPMLSLLAQRTTKAAMFPISLQSGRLPIAPAADVFNGLSSYLGKHRRSGGHPMALEGSFARSIIHRVARITGVTLRHLDLLQREIQTIGQAIAASTDVLCSDQLDVLDVQLRSLLVEVLKAHACSADVALDRQWASCLITTIESRGSDESVNNTLPESHHLRHFSQVLAPCRIYLNAAPGTESDRFAVAAHAWIAFAIGCINLYVPDQVVDPALRPSVERSLFRKARTALEVKLSALRTFEQNFTGSDSTLRMQLVQQKLASMGDEPPVPEVARPPESELSLLQGEFTNLLKVVDTVARSSKEKGLTGLHEPLVRRNLCQILRRLTDGYWAYADITGPVIGFLNCLEIGMVLASRACSMITGDDGISRYVSDLTPFMGASSVTILEHVKPRLSKTTHHYAVHLRLHALSSLVLVRRVREHATLVGQEEQMFELFHMFYEHWKDQLLIDQEKETAKSGLYRYRGGQTPEDDEAAIRDVESELFPDFDQSTGLELDVEDAAFLTPQQLAVRLATLHADIFGTRYPVTDRIRQLLEQSGSLIASLDKGQRLQGAANSLNSTLCVILSMLQRGRKSLSSTSLSTKAYNIYSDPNIQQAQQLVLLIHKIQRRFQQMQQTWPDEATLGHVLDSCDDVLALRHVEPVAKFIPKVEKLHGFIYEWQRIASKEFSAANLYDDLTELLFSWRKLELSTWARLFDLEIEKSVEDAKSWWFVAYESVIAVPESLALSPKEMLSHTRELLKTLETFFLSTTLGQYSQRLRLLEQFQEHLALRMVTVPSMRAVHDGLANFISYYSRFEKPVREALEKGRQNLQKDVRTVIQLASWKDRNIDALRQSAKSSHKKLARLVRKFRTVLGQPVSSLLREPPLEEAVVANFHPANLRTGDYKVDSAALQLCLSHIPSWEDRPSRFRNISATVAVMRRRSQPSSSSVDGSDYIESFLVDLESTIKYLQKATPSVLTAENKEMVKHLKTRKRKLFADTLKDLRQMGFRTNPSGDVLARQESLSTVLASMASSTGSASSVSLSSAEGYLHRLLDTMPQVREVSREHSEDLTAAEVGRSVGYLETLLAAAIKQRGTLVRYAANQRTLTAVVDKIKSLWVPDKYRIEKVVPSALTVAPTLQSAIAWLPSITSVGADIIVAHAELGQLDSSEVVDRLRGWSARLEALRRDLVTLPVLPDKLTTSKHREVYQAAEYAVDEFKSNVNKWRHENPLVSCILEQVALWTGSEPDRSEQQYTSIEKYSIDIKTCKESVFRAIDLVLGSMQDLNKAMDSLPSSTEEPGWLMQEERCLTSALSSLHAIQICTALDTSMSYLHHLSHDQNNLLQVAAAIFTTVLPIIQQYQNIFAQALARLAKLHGSTCKMAYQLAKCFAQIATQGFCTPSEKSSSQDGQTEKLESGTGLGEGEGAEDISKDIGDDEDLTELAQEPSKKNEKEEIEDEKDAVDMADKEMEGEIGDVSEKGEDEAGSGEDDGNDEIDEDTGSVDDLGPSTVDEKMWNGDKDEAEKDQQGDQSKGDADEDEKVNAQEQDGKVEKREETEEGQDDEPDVGVDESEAVGREEPETADPHMQDGENLELPDELNMDGKLDGGEESEFDSLEGDGDEKIGAEEELDQDMAEVPDDTEVPQEMAVEEEHEGEGEETGEAAPDSAEHNDDDPSEDTPRDKDDGLLQDHSSDPMTTDKEQPSDVQGTGTNAKGQEDEQETNSVNTAKQEEGAEGEASGQDQQQAASKAGKPGESAQNQAGSGENNELEDSPIARAFKRLGDPIEKFYRQQSQIRNPSQEQRDSTAPEQQDIDMADADFEHLQDEEARADAQALGTATEDQATALDEANALPSKDQDKIPQGFQPDEEDAGKKSDYEDDIEMHDVEESVKNTASADMGGLPNAFVGRNKDFDEDEPMTDSQNLQDAEDNIEEVDIQLTNTHLEQDSESSRSLESARRLWLHHEASTRALSNILTEHLRLILSPTQATKMRGDYRTGKRLNIKRIIGYIASGYKRDKIWMRRSVPSKRAYQIMLAIDDSHSMADSGCGNLALETVALVARSLAKLEVGQLCVLGFGDSVTVAHDFDVPFTADAGVNVFRHFGFRQTRTDAKKLLAHSIELFRDARLRAAGSAAELWQLQLVVSDAILEDHPGIRQLVRQAQEERIMIVFIIVDAQNQRQHKQQVNAQGQATPDVLHPSAIASASDPAAPSKSIMDLETAEFIDGQLIRRRYLDTFPFRYYLVVRDVAELPNVLAGALRQWFGEVAGSGGY